jgi:hypothetical protein
MTEVIINKKSTINAEGTHNTNGCKKVFCITTRQTFTSVKDAAILCNVSESEVSRCCNGTRGRKTVKGLRFCFLKDIALHLEEIFDLDRETLEKAAAYDAIKAEERAAEEAKAKYEADLAEAEEQCSFFDALIDKLSSELAEAHHSCEEAYARRQFLRETGVQYVM